MDDEIKSIVFWQVSPSIHQAPFIRQLDQQLTNVNIVCVFTRGIDEKRTSLGWKMPDYGNAKVLFESNTKELGQIYQEYSECSIHIFSSLFVSKSIRTMYLQCIKKNPLLVGVMSEGYNPSGIKGVLRKIRRSLYESKLLQGADFILSIGKLSYNNVEPVRIRVRRGPPHPIVSRKR